MKFKSPAAGETWRLNTSDMPSHNINVVASSQDNLAITLGPAFGYDGIITFGVNRMFDLFLKYAKRA